MSESEARQKLDRAKRDQLVTAEQCAQMIRDSQVALAEAMRASR